MTTNRMGLEQIPLSDERLESFIANPLENGLSRSEQMDMARRLLAFEKASKDPVGSFHIVDQRVDGTTDYIADGDWPIDNGELVVYAAPQLQAVTVPTKEHELRELVNDLRDVAIKYRDAQQLREHIARVLRSNSSTC